MRLGRQLRRNEAKRVACWRRRRYCKSDGVSSFTLLSLQYSLASEIPQFDKTEVLSRNFLHFETPKSTKSTKVALVVRFGNGVGRLISKASNEEKVLQDDPQSMSWIRRRAEVAVIALVNCDRAFSFT
jgi:hypothetical protein